MTSNANMDPIKFRSQPRRSNPFVKLSSSIRRKLFKSYSSEGSVTSIATAETTLVVKFVRFSEKQYIRKTLSRVNYTIEESKASWLSREESQQIWRQCDKEIKKIDDGKKFKDKTYTVLGALKDKQGVDQYRKNKTERGPSTPCCSTSN
jgi:hypothetical protein